MKNKSIFTQIILLIVISVICLLLTVLIAILVGTAGTELFDFSNLNLSNMIPVFIIGVFVSCIIVGIAILFLARTVFFKVKDYFSEETKTNNGGNKK